MALRLILILAALFALWWGLRWWSRAPVDKARKALTGAVLALLVAGGIVLVATGKIAGLLAIAAGLAPWISRVLHLHGLWQRLRPAPGGTQAGEAPPPPRNDGAMTAAQAYEILGLAPGATSEQIREAHRRLMRANHPDAGGSTWIAARLNQARDLLLG